MAERPSASVGFQDGSEYLRRFGPYCELIHDPSSGLGPASVVTKAEDSQKTEDLPHWTLPKFAQTRFVQTVILAGSTLLAACSPAGSGEVKATSTPDVHPTATPIGIGSRLQDTFRNYPAGLDRAEKVAAKTASEAEILQFNVDVTLRDCQPGDWNPMERREVGTEYYVKAKSVVPLRTKPSKGSAILGAAPEGTNLSIKCGVPTDETPAPGDDRKLLFRLVATPLGEMGYVNPIIDPLQNTEPVIAPATATPTAQRPQEAGPTAETSAFKFKDYGVYHAQFPNGEIMAAKINNEIVIATIRKNIPCTSAQLPQTNILSGGKAPARSEGSFSGIFTLGSNGVSGSLVDNATLRGQIAGGQAQYNNEFGNYACTTTNADYEAREAGIGQAAVVETFTGMLRRNPGFLNNVNDESAKEYFERFILRGPLP